MLFDLLVYFSLTFFAYHFWLTLHSLFILARVLSYFLVHSNFIDKQKKNFIALFFLFYLKNIKTQA